MFHVFSNNNAARSGVLGAKLQNREPEPCKRKAALSSLTRSCAECRRRRIKCDSLGPPCGQCSWYKVEDACYFPARRRRNVPASRFDVRQRQYRTKLTNGQNVCRSPGHCRQELQGPEYSISNEVFGSASQVVQRRARRIARTRTSPVR
jgi:Fungal Zn(2)-Cys(6) binuclear cluster domain